MIYPESRLNVSDNSAAQNVKCIKVMKASRSAGAVPGSLLVVSIKKIKANKNIFKGQVHKALLIRGKKNIQRKTGLSIKFNENSVILLDQKNLPLASRIIGPIYSELRYKNYPKVLILSKMIV